MNDPHTPPSDRTAFAGRRFALILQYWNVRVRVKPGRAMRQYA
jgi:hypothetical protein